ncbi:serine/threonine protein kinase [Nonomuraea sp. NBC_00507]|uniref:serine/threonine-protein kinase n=1 Tax=Nonomuraea sp. NBC_00507 TaxID=2976002 RepID=UPI002E17C0B2
MFRIARVSARRVHPSGQGSVFLGESPDGQRVAIKMLHARYAADADTRRCFLREAEVAARVAAFCTARVIGTGLVAERPYIVSEYVPGTSLDELVKRDGPRTGSGLERLPVSTLTALASIHSAGIVHRDFKPSNVILGPEGPVVIDFGIARAIDHVTSNTSLLGTPAYMSPEQLSAETLSPASDMFSWAGTMVFAASGRIPFSGVVVPAILHAILHAEPEVSAVPGPLRPLVLACLAKDPTARPAAAQVLRDLTGRTNTGGYDNRVAPAGGAGGRRRRSSCRAGTTPIRPRPLRGTARRGGGPPGSSPLRTCPPGHQGRKGAALSPLRGRAAPGPRP